MSDTFPPAPPLQVSRWFNTPAPITLDDLRGRVVALHAFQMLCPGCVSHGLPQARRMAQIFDAHEFSIVGLHTVFEHHDVMTERALHVFIQEYRLRFPIGVDQASPNGSVPLTMRALGLRGTPSLVLLDKRGRVRFSHLGEIDDMALGGIVGRLLGEPGPAPDETADGLSRAAATP
ncbi:MAG: redoxin domain-containing protein [Burkholderiales bacterium]|nr:redoxin domain-containing protein [Burkholderiales bacterium]